MATKRVRRTAKEIIASGDPLYRFGWPRDQDGYQIIPGRAADPNAFTLLAGAAEPAVIKGLGGPLTYYRPMQTHPGLWLEFGDRCVSPETALDFANKYGLPSYGYIGAANAPEKWTVSVDTVLSNAAYMREMIRLIKANEREAAIEFFNDQWNGSANMKILNGAVRPVPATLISAMQIQAAESLMGNQEWRRCQNPACGNPPFRIGFGYTKARKFCSDRCRIAADRLLKAAGET